MAKLVVLYTRPQDTEGFDEHYTGTHAPLAATVPGSSWAFVRMTSTPRGGEPAYYLMAEATFTSDDDLQAALGSDEMRATGRDAAQMTQRFGNEAVMLIGSEQG